MGFEPTTYTRFADGGLEPLGDNCINIQSGITPDPPLFCSVKAIKVNGFLHMVITTCDILDSTPREIRTLTPFGTGF